MSHALTDKAADENDHKKTHADISDKQHTRRLRQPPGNINRKDRRIHNPNLPNDDQQLGSSMGRGSAKINTVLKVVAVWENCVIPRN